jgi:hypothetical protein
MPKLTDSAIKAAKCPPEKDRIELADSSCPGLYLRVTKNGAKDLRLQVLVAEPVQAFARLQLHQGRIAKALTLLQSVYDRFSEGFETADLKTAKAFLNSWQ